MVLPVNISGTAAQLDAILAVRRDHAQHEAAMLTAQRECGDDRGTARFFKGEVRAARRMQKAANTWLGWFERAEPKPRDFPAELGLELRIVLGAAREH